MSINATGRCRCRSPHNQQIIVAHTYMFSTKGKLMINHSLSAKTQSRGTPVSRTRIELRRTTRWVRCFQPQPAEFHQRHPSLSHVRIFSTRVYPVSSCRTEFAESRSRGKQDMPHGLSMFRIPRSQGRREPSGVAAVL